LEEEQQRQEQALEQQQQQLLQEQDALEQQRKATAAVVVTATAASVAASARNSPEPTIITLMISVLSHNGEFQKRQKLSGVLANGNIADVKALIERRSGLKASAQRLRMDDRSTPPEDASLKMLGLADGSHLELLRPPPKKHSAPVAAPIPAMPVAAPERTSSGSSSDRSTKPSAFAAVAAPHAAVSRTPTRSGRAQQLQANQVRLLPFGADRY
jgi:hypothetical protein